MDGEGEQDEEGEPEGGEVRGGDPVADEEGEGGGLGYVDRYPCLW